jgi:hypothetical protein
MAELSIKVIEVRDKGTCIGALAVRMFSPDRTAPLGYWLRRYGYPADGSSIMLIKLSDGRATNDPYEWPGLTGDRRTMPVAHNWIINNWDDVADGDVVDVQVILGETGTPKTSERVGAF